MGKREAGEEEEDVVIIYDDDDNNNNNNNNDGCGIASFETPLDQQQEQTCFPFQFYTDDDDDDDEGFAAEFYRCGTDCSSVLSLQGGSGEEEAEFNPHPNNNNNNNPTPPEKKLKQSNLFQSWGLKNSHDNGNDLNNKKKKKKKAKQGDLLQMWGLSTNTNNNNNPDPPYFSIHTKTRSSNPVMNKSRPCPFYKKIPGTPFTVDAFRFGAIQGCLGYILTHFHADHYGGLTKSWSHGPIYCTPLTARLLTICLYLQPQYIHPLELDTEHVIEGITVTLLEANHCPGAALIHLRLPNGQCILHTGDFRASKNMQQYPLLSDRRVDVVYLDTTYCNQKYRFPAKEDVLRFVVREVENRLRNQPKTLIVVGAYSIGKECVYIAISKALGAKIHADPRRRRILQSFGWSELSSNLTSDGKETPLHVLPMSSLKFEVLERYLKTYSNRYTAVLAFKPTGWTYSESIGSHLDLIKPISKGRVTIYGVPYSEHSSFLELEEFLKFLRPDKIIPTVNVGNAAHRDRMQTYFRDWLK